MVPALPDAAEAAATPPAPLPAPSKTGPPDAAEAAATAPPPLPATGPPEDGANEPNTAAAAAAAATPAPASGTPPPPLSISTPTTGSTEMEIVIHVPRPSTMLQRTSTMRRTVSEEKPEVMWTFIRNLYFIFASQAFLSTAIAAMFFKLGRIMAFFAGHTILSWLAYIVVLLSAPLVLYITVKHRKHHPCNVLLLGTFTVCSSFSACLIVSPKGFLVYFTVLLTTATSISLILFSVWARTREYKLTFFGPAVISGSTAAITFAVIQIYASPAPFSSSLYCLICSLIITTVMIFEVNKLCKIHTSKELVIASIALYIELLKHVFGQTSFSLV